MAFKLTCLILSLYLTNSFVSGENANPCVCDEEETEKGKVSLWDFFVEQEKLEAAGEVTAYPVIPGMLPRLPCSNCIEMSRKKRKTDEKVTASVIREKRRSIQLSTRNCAHGYYRLGAICVSKFIVEKRFGLL